MEQWQEEIEREIANIDLECSTGSPSLEKAVVPNASSPSTIEVVPAPAELATAWTNATSITTAPAANTPNRLLNPRQTSTASTAPSAPTSNKLLNPRRRLPKQQQPIQNTHTVGGNAAGVVATPTESIRVNPLQTQMHQVPATTLQPSAIRASTTQANQLPRTATKHQAKEAVEYVSPLADYTTGNNTTVITPQSSATENDRHLYFLDEIKTVGQDGAVNGKSSSAKGIDGITNLTVIQQLSIALGFSAPTVLATNTKCTSAAELESARRELRIRLSMDDPTIDECHRKAHQMFVAGSTLTDMRANGITIKHFIEIGIKFADWAQRCEFGLKELAFMEGDWCDAVVMGFQPVYITSCREKNGPSVLTAPPFNVKWDNLERDLGLTIDEAVFECQFTTADFAVLSENIATMVNRGFAPIHAEHMREPPNNFEISLKACEADLNFLFPGRIPQEDCSSSQSNHVTRPTVSAFTTLPPDTTKLPPQLVARDHVEHGTQEPEPKRSLPRTSTRGYVVSCRRKAKNGEPAMSNIPFKKTGAFNGLNLQ